MSNSVIKVENLSKQYRLGSVGTGTLSHDINRWWARVRGKEDPYLRVHVIENRKHKNIADIPEYVWAIRDINLEIKQGEVLGIIGKNGAGKSTLLKILSRVTSPTLGEIKVKGRIASLLEVGTGFHPELTGKENIFLNGAILGMTKQEIKSKYDAIVEFSGVDKYINTPVKRYSSGMYVRLAFAVAAHLEPEILVVDEVLAVGDAEFQKKCLGKMQDVSREGRTVLFVSHNMEAVQNLCTQVMLLNAGKMEAIGETPVMIQKYLSDTFDLLQGDSLNFFKKVTRRGYGEMMFEDIKVINSKGDVNTFEVLEGTDVEFKMKVKFRKPIEGAMCLIAFKSTKFDQVVAGSERYLLDQTKIDANGVMDFSIFFRKLPLLPGRYNLSFWLGTLQKKGRQDVLDRDIPPLIVQSKRTINFEIPVGFFTAENQILYAK